MTAAPAPAVAPIPAVARHRLACLPTPLHRLRGLEQALGRPELWVKRDDLTGFALGGNKARPLEFLIGDAIARGADVLVTGGAPTSNYCQAAAVAARAAGLACALAIAGDGSGGPTVNLEIARSAGARVTYTGAAERESVDAAVERLGAELEEAGRRPYILPRGGATALGGLGFAAAATELQQQLAEVGCAPEAVVLATGSGGSHAGLLAGALAAGATWSIHGASVSRDPTELSERVLEIAAGTADLIGGPRPEPSDVHLVDARGAGFGVAGPRDLELTRQVLCTDGILLDAAYTAKALGRAVELARAAAGPMVFWHTGGTVSAVTAYLTGPAA